MSIKICFLRFEHQRRRRRRRRKQQRRSSTIAQLFECITENEIKNNLWKKNLLQEFRK